MRSYQAILGLVAALAATTAEAGPVVSLDQVARWAQDELLPRGSSSSAAAGDDLDKRGTITCAACVFAVEHGITKITKRGGDDDEEDSSEIGLERRMSVTGAMGTAAKTVGAEKICKHMPLHPCGGDDEKKSD